MMPRWLLACCAGSVAGELLITSLAWRRSRPLALLGLAGRAMSAGVIYRAVTEAA